MERETDQHAKCHATPRRESSRSMPLVFAVLLGCAGLLGCGGGAASDDASIDARTGTDAGVAIETDAGVAIDNDAGVAIETDAGVAIETDAGVAIETDADVDAAVAADAGSSASAWVCRRTASITCDCQDGGDPTTFPIADCSHMPDGRRFCAAAIHTLSGSRIPICQCWNAERMIDDLVATWSASPESYTEIRDTTTCPPP